MRDQLDSFILEHARAEVRQGAVVRKVTELPDRVTVETQDGAQYSGKYLIGADGANSVVAHALGLRRKKNMAAAIEAEVPVSAEMMQKFGRQPVFIFEEIRLGYLWIFPKPDHLSVGIAAMHPKHGELQDRLRKVMGRYGICLDGVPFRGHPIPLYNGREPITTARCLLAGDAAGLVDPLSGEGIRFSIKSGRMAAEAILSGHPEGYARAVWRAIGTNHAFALAVARIFFALEHLCLVLGAPNPFTTWAIAELLSDHSSTAGIMLTAIATLPIFVATETIARVAGLFGARTAGNRIRAAVYPDVIRIAG
jgi:flavin-dependent dehydrogenase